MAKVILLDPLGYGKSSFRHSHFLRDWTGGWMPGFVPFPPLDLMYTAAYLRQHKYDVEIIEANVNHWTHKETVRIVRKKHPDFILLPSSYFTFKDDRYLSKLIKRDIPHAKIIFAGPLVTYDPSSILLDNNADFVALGEYELPVLNIIEGNYAKNVAYRSGNKVIKGERSLLDLNELPMPARDLIDNKAYRYAIFNKRNPVTAMTISRGCPHSKCEFCHSNLYSLGQIRHRNIEDIIEEINEIVYKHGIQEVFFRDQTFTADREIVYDICEYIISHNIDILWRVSTRVDLVDRELLTLMRKAGCFQVSFGFESSSQKLLDMNNKGITIEQSKRAVMFAKEAGMEVVGLFICGMPGDINASMKNLSKFILGLNIDYVNFKTFHIVPGSPFYEKYNAYNTINKRRSLFTNKLAKIHTIIAFLRFYIRPRYLLKQLNKIKSWSDFRFLLRTGLCEFLFHF